MAKELRVGTNYRLGLRIGSGSFGEIYGGIHLKTQEEVAIKLEQIRTRCPQLQHERKVYRDLQNIGKLVLLFLLCQS